MVIDVIGDSFVKRKMINKRRKKRMKRKNDEGKRGI